MKLYLKPFFQVNLGKAFWLKNIPGHAFESTKHAILTRPEAENPTLGPRPPNPINYSLRRQDVFFQVDLKKTSLSIHRLGRLGP